MESANTTASKNNLTMPPTPRNVHVATNSATKYASPTGNGNGGGGMAFKYAILSPAPQPAPSQPPQPPPPTIQPKGQVERRHLPNTTPQPPVAPSGSPVVALGRSNQNRFSAKRTILIQPQASHPILQPKEAMEGVLKNFTEKCTTGPILVPKSTTATVNPVGDDAEAKMHRKLVDEVHEIFAPIPVNLTTSIISDTGDGERGGDGDGDGDSDESPYNADSSEESESDYDDDEDGGEDHHADATAASTENEKPKRNSKRSLTSASKKRQPPPLLPQHQCEICGKVYKHANCFIKHRWEHQEEAWEMTRQFCPTKHQQVMALEAAAILASLVKAPPPSTTGKLRKQRRMNGRKRTVKESSSTSSSPPPVSDAATTTTAEADCHDSRER